MVVTDSHFQGNLARDVGSALFLLDGEVFFSNTVFEHHKVDLATSLRSGSFPVYVTSGSFVCDDCTFSNNSFSFESDTESVTTGAICFAGGVGAIRRTNFTYNSGALVTTPPGPRFLGVTECNFEDNILGQAVIDASAGVISLANCSLGDVIPDDLTNSGDSAAPIYSFSAPVTLSLVNSTLLRRKIQTTSPFFEVRGEAQVSIEDSTITDQHNSNDPTGVYSTANFTSEHNLPLTTLPFSFEKLTSILPSQKWR
jgi:hypothetical protein